MPKAAPFVRSWKTTIVAALVAVNAVLHAVLATLDGDPATVPDWNVVIALTVVAIGLFFSKDADRTGV